MSWRQEPRLRRRSRLVRAGVVCAVMASAHGCSNEGSNLDGEQQGLGGSKSSGTGGTAGTTAQGGGATAGTSSGGASSGGGNTSGGNTSGGNGGDANVGGTVSAGGVGGMGASEQGGMGATGGGQVSTGGSGGDGGGGTVGGMGGSGQGGIGGTGGGQVSTGGSGGDGGMGGAVPACPKLDGEICHEFFANDNGRHEIIYVNEFDPTKTWTQPTQDKASGNSPRQLEVVDNPMATDGRAILVSVESGYEEYDFVTHGLLAQVNLGNISVRGAQRLPDGNTVLGFGDATLRVVTAEGATVGTECSLPGTGEDTLRVLSRDAASGDIYYGRGLQMFAVNMNCQQQWTATFGDSSSKAYRVLPRPGGGAWGATGYPASVVEVNAAGQVVNEVGGLDGFPGVLDFSSGFDLTGSGNIVIANWWGHVASPPQEGPHLVELTPANEIVWRWGTQADATQITNVLVVR